jgi:cardiolipin synthase
VTVLPDGALTLGSMFAAIAAAKNHVNLEYYVFEDITSDGRHLVDLLVDKRRQGVAINVIYDGFGSLGTPAAVFERLKAAGAQVVEYNPLNPLDARAGYAPNDRDHRKILVVDGRIGIVGGVNLASEYETRPLPKLAGSDGQAMQYWRDLDVEIEGPAVADLQAVFIEHWAQQHGPALDGIALTPRLEAKGEELVRIIASTKDDTVPAYYATMLSAIRAAEQRIWISTAYFVPTHREQEDLADAARRGVDVELLLPSISDSDFALSVGHAAYEDLLEAGVKIHEIQGEVLHSKIAVIDGVWAAVGSSNVDHRSVLFNDEIDAVILGRATAARLEAFIADGIARSRPIEPARWSDRPLGERLKEFFLGAWQGLL